MNLRASFLALFLALACALGCNLGPERVPTFTVQGEVSAPGTYAYQADMTVYDALAMAGILPERSDLAHVEIHRGGGAGSRFVVDLERMRRTGDSSANVLVRAGDTIVVRRKWR